MLKTDLNGLSHKRCNVKWKKSSKISMAFARRELLRSNLVSEPMNLQNLSMSTSFQSPLKNWKSLFFSFEILSIMSRSLIETTFHIKVFDFDRRLERKWIPWILLVLIVDSKSQKSGRRVIIDYGAEFLAYTYKSEKGYLVPLRHVSVEIDKISVSFDVHPPVTKGWPR